MSTVKTLVVAMIGLPFFGLSLPAVAATASNAETGAHNSNAHPGMSGGMSKMMMKKHMMKKHHKMM